jgi:hypothetical protein
MADAEDSKSSVGNHVRVQVPPSASKDLFEIRDNQPTRGEGGVDFWSIPTCCVTPPAFIWRTPAKTRALFSFIQAIKAFSVPCVARNWRRPIQGLLERLAWSSPVVGKQRWITCGLLFNKIRRRTRL